MAVALSALNGLHKSPLRYGDEPVVCRDGGKSEWSAQHAFVAELVRLGLTTEAAALLARRAVTRQALGFAAYR